MYRDINIPPEWFTNFNQILDLILKEDLLEIRVRLSIFTIISVFAGLPALVWSVSDLIHHRQNGHHISIFIILLLLTDFVELFLSPCIVIKFFFSLDGTFKVFWALLWASRECGILLHQLVALKGILSVKYALCNAYVFSSPCLIIFYILVFLCIFIGRIILESLNRIFIALLVLIVTVITWIMCCRASCSADSHSHTSRKLDYHILVVFILILLVLHLPYIFLSFLSFSSEVVELLLLWLIPYFLMSVRLISDPLLCLLVCRQNLSV